MPSTLPVGLREPLARGTPAAPPACRPAGGGRGRAKMSSTKILQPSCSPKKLMFEPTTGPEVEQHGRLGRDRRLAMNFFSALVPTTGSRRRRAGPADLGVGRAALAETGQEARHFPTTRQGNASLVRAERPGRRPEPAGRPGRRCRTTWSARRRPWRARPARGGRRRGLGLDLGRRRRRRRAGSALRCMSTLPRKCAPSAIATRGATMSPSTEPLSRMSTFSLAADVARHLAEDDHRLGVDLGLDLVRADRSSGRGPSARSGPRRGPRR